MDLKHHFLLPMPTLAGDYFADSLTYICEHNEEGAMGILINRPSDLSLVELFSHLNFKSGLTGSSHWVDTPVMEGGPVATSQGFVLHTSDRRYATSMDLGHTLCLSTALEVLESIASGSGPEKFLVALGYAGWGAGQLESELSNNVWLTTDANLSVLFELPYENRLDAAARALGVDLRLISRPGHA